MYNLVMELKEATNMNAKLDNMKQEAATKLGVDKASVAVVGPAANGFMVFGVITKADDGQDSFGEMVKLRTRSR